MDDEPDDRAQDQADDKALDDLAHSNLDAEDLGGESDNSEADEGD